MSGQNPNQSGDRVQGAAGVDVNLVYFKPDGSQKVIPLKEGRHVVGRTDEAKLRIPLATVSRQHCELVFEGESLVIRDLGSSNGTFVNYERVADAKVSPGDVLGIGPACVFTVQIDGHPAKVDPPSDSSGESSLMETPPAGLDTSEDSPLENVTANDLSESNSDDTVTKTGMGSLLPKDGGGDSSMFDFDFDFEDDENPSL